LLVAGASGLMGAHLLQAFEAIGPAVGTALTQEVPKLERFDLVDSAAAAALVARHRPAAVVCAAAISNVERCELEPQQARAVNVDGTLALALAAREAGATFIFLSSEYVFDGQAGPYGEDDPVSPINEYGRQKVAVEQELAQSGDDWIVARVSCVYGHERRRKNFAYRLFDALREGHELKVPGDQVGTPTEAKNAATVIAELWSAGERGIFHVVGADRMIRSDFGVVIAEELGLDPELVRPTPTGELGLAAPRPLGAGLLNGRVAARASTRLLGVREGIRSVLAAAPLAPGAGS
jgi:dTDP-4-dehydrorhamnose reductase